MSHTNQEPEKGNDLKIELPANPLMKDFQIYIEQLEAMHGWQDVDLVHNCFLMGEEVGELFKAIRYYEKIYKQSGDQKTQADHKQDVAEELVDVFNYLIALANRLDIDLEEAFRHKNGHNQTRSWQS